MAAEVFAAERGRLVGIAYGMLGQIADAEDVVQDAYLRWVRAAAGEVREPAALLTTIVTRLAIDRSRVLRREREGYPGPWLPEPVVSGGDAAVRVEQAERVGYALLATLERLNPVDRAVLLLRDVFDLDYAQIAPIVHRTPENCRQIAVRARDRVGDPRVRRRPGRREARRLQWAFARAVQRGDLSRLMEVLAADVVHHSDGGPDISAARRPVMGADRVARLWAGLAGSAPPDATARFVTVNGEPGIRLDRPAGPWALVILDGGDGRITALRLVSNPAKLAALGAPPRPTVREAVVLGLARLRRG